MKLTYFILKILALIFVSLRVYHSDFMSSSQWFSGAYNLIRKVFMVLAAILLVLIFKSIVDNKIYYLYIFLGLVSLPIMYEFYHFKKEKILFAKERAHTEWQEKMEKKYMKAWQQIDEPEKALSLFENIKPYQKYKPQYDLALKEIETNKTAFYLALGIHDSTYYQAFLEREKTACCPCNTVQLMLYYNYKQDKRILNTDDDYLKVVNLLLKEKSPFLCIPTNANRFLNFEYLIAQKFYKSALKMLSISEINNVDYYLEIAHTITDEAIKKQVVEFLKSKH